MNEKPSTVSGKSPVVDKGVRILKQKTEVVTVTPPPEKRPQTDFNIEVMLNQVLSSSNFSIETLQKILDMRKELKAEYAKEQFDIAMATFQAKCPVIEKVKAGGKTKEAKDPAYYYAPLEYIVHCVKHLLEETGLSFSFDTNCEGSRVIATCMIRHRAGHREERTVNLAKSAGTSIMSPTQVEAANMTFARRYAFCNAFGIATGGEDSDAQEVVVDTRSVQNTTGVGGNGNVFVAGAAGPVTPTEDANCAECGNLIQEPSVVAFSIARYKKPVCRSCQSKLSPSV